MPLRVDELEFDEYKEAEMSRHGVVREDEFREISRLADRKGMSIDELIKTALLGSGSQAPKPRRSRRTVRT